MDKLIIGSHVSFKKDTQLLGSVMEALSYGANTFMFYTGAPQNTNRVSISRSITEKAFLKMKENGINPNDIIVHAPYIINLANNEKLESYTFACNFLKQEIQRCEELGMKKLVLHPGSFVKLTREEGIKNIINALNDILLPTQSVYICLETMAGKGSEVGICFEELKQIIDGVKYNDKLKVCLDTCHLNDSGYDVSKFEELLNEFDKIIGISKIGCIHINDSKNEKGSHKDRHENIGFGKIGFSNLINIIYNDKLKEVPKILETPYVGDEENSKERLYPPYKFEIEMIRNKRFDCDIINKIRNYYK